jgi:hypothetical protein
MKVSRIKIECDMPDCLAVFQAVFVNVHEMNRHLCSAKREGWRKTRMGNEMVDLCPGHVEVI